MAKEITALQSTVERDNTRRWRVFYHYQISPRVQNAKGSDVVPLSSGGIPSEALAHFTSGERTTLQGLVDAGDRGYLTADVEQSIGESDAAFVIRLRAHLAGMAVFRIQQFRDQWAKAGTQVDG